MQLEPSFPDIRDAVQKLCKRFPGQYWRGLDEQRAYPEEFVKELTASGFLSVLIPEQYGGSGLGLAAANAILEEIQRSGGNGGACHAQMYTMGTLLRHGSDEQKARYLPQIAAGELRLQAFGVTEPGSGTDTTRIRTTAQRRGDSYIVNGQKVFISRAQQSDLMILLVRTSARETSERASDGMSVLIVD
ncbi:MAG TPA: acyl-CoA dehydrogenase family protein, partial [Xanthomonadales bacterium]|nr:acyl-CoA dehydrogenase family protein [Xanthomonadales bacterium]